MSEACTNNTEREAPQQRGPLTHVLSVDSFDRLLENVLAFYQKAKAAYYATDPNTPALPDAAKKWERASIALISRAEALFRLSGENQELRKQALELITACAQDASVREMMIAAYTERAVSTCITCPVPTGRSVPRRCIPNVSSAPPTTWTR